MRSPKPNKVSTWVRATAVAATLVVSSMVGASSSLAPSFSLPSRTGEVLSLDKLKGQVVMLNFWASWCGPCRTEMPLLDQMHKRYSSLGFTLVGVNVEPDAKGAEAWLSKQKPVSFPIAFDTDSKVSKMYKVAGMPSTVFVDRKGNIRVMHKGYKPGDENIYLTQIRSMLKE